MKALLSLVLVAFATDLPGQLALHVMATLATPDNPRVTAFHPDGIDIAIVFPNGNIAIRHEHGGGNMYTALAASASNPVQATYLDFDGDGVLDLAVAYGPRASTSIAPPST